MTMAHGERARDGVPTQVAPKHDRRPVRYRIGLVVRATVRRIDLACMDGRIQSFRLGERTLFTLAGERLSGPQVLRPGVEVRVASVDSSRGTIAVLVELLGSGPRRTGRPSSLLPALRRPQA